MNEEETKNVAPEAANDAPVETPLEATVEPSNDVPMEVKTVVAPHRDLKPGMVIRVHEVIKDVNAKGEERERVQVFEGTILGISGAGISRNMTVRKVSGGIGVEKIYPLASPHVAKVEVVKQLRVRRAKLFFLRRGDKKRNLKEAIA